MREKGERERKGRGREGEREKTLDIPCSFCFFTSNFFESIFAVISKYQFWNLSTLQMVDLAVEREGGRERERERERERVPISQLLESEAVSSAPIE